MTGRRMIVVHTRLGGHMVRVEAALRRGAFLAHNHPKGSVAPSEHDNALPRATVLIAEPVSVQVVDHLIVSANKTYSFRKAGLL